MHITAAGVYSISGTLTDGCIDVDAKGKVYLEFDGVDITSSSGPALIITDAKKVTLTLVDGTTNYLTDAAADNEYDAALFTNDTLIINGAGTLVVTGNNNEGISSDDDIIINAGTVEVTAVDDGLNAHDDITITGGDVYIHAGGDGLDSNGTINISGGALISLGSTAGGDGGLDAVGALTITGGFVVAGGNSIVAPGSDSSQASVFVGTGATQAAGTAVTLTRDGEEILVVTPDKEFQNLLISSSRLIADATYQAYVGSSVAAVTVTAAIRRRGGQGAATGRDGSERRGLRPPTCTSAHQSRVERAAAERTGGAEVLHRSPTGERRLRSSAPDLPRRQGVTRSGRSTASTSTPPTSTSISGLIPASSSKTRCASAGTARSTTRI